MTAVTLSVRAHYKMARWRARHQYAVTSDGQQFIVMEPAADAPPESLTIVTKWTTLLKK